MTLGDPSGIGPEVTIKALEDPELPVDFHPIVVGSRGTLMDALERWARDFRQISDKKFLLSERSFYFVDVATEITGSIPVGKVSREGGIVASETTRKAVNLAKNGVVQAIVTAPVNKKSFHLAGLRYPGQTEFLAELTGTSSFAMMLIGKNIRSTLVTTHLPISEVSKNLTSSAILEKIELTDRALYRFFGCDNPKIAVAALNPHAGDEGCFGYEEERIISPAIDSARARHIDAIGPLPADSLFPKAAQGKFDAVVAMYHDQGIIPVKLEAFGSGVNMTLGLPFVRVSVDHGTAYDIAGKGVADSSSMTAAIRTALALIKDIRLK